MNIVYYIHEDAGCQYREAVYVQGLRVWPDEDGTQCPSLPYGQIIFKLRNSNFGIWVKQILKQRSWAFLVHCLIS